MPMRRAERRRPRTVRCSRYSVANPGSSPGVAPIQIREQVGEGCGVGARPDTLSTYGLYLSQRLTINRQHLPQLQYILRE